MLSDRGIIYTLEEKIQGNVYNCQCLLFGNEYVVKIYEDPQAAQREIQVLNLVRGKIGFAQIVDMGTSKFKQQAIRFIILQKLGCSLNDVRLSGKSIETSITQLQAQQIISILENLHDLGYLHTQVLPDHLMFDIERKQIHLIDFSHTKKVGIRDPDTVLGGNSWFGIPFVLAGRCPDRRDDIIQAIYCIQFLLDGLEYLSKKCSGPHFKQKLKFYKCTRSPQRICNHSFLSTALETAQMCNFGVRPDYYWIRNCMIQGIDEIPEEPTEKNEIRNQIISNYALFEMTRTQKHSH